MMKRILTICLLSALTLSLDAQPAFLRRHKKADDKSRQLQMRLDSLKAIVDSLESRLAALDSLQEDYTAFEAPQGVEEALAEMPAADSVRREEETAANTDSLLHLWYKQRRISDYERPDYDMDSVRFTSDVSDEVMMERLRKMNSFITLPFNSTVKNYMVLYAEKMPSRMGQVLGLSSYYMPIFEEIFDRYHLPVELKYMAVIESMLNPVAESRAGARGMWQFMYRTGRIYGLKINSFVDERLDVEKAADAAARYLADAYATFGDWNLAISSYNCGPGNVNKAIRRAGGSRDFWDIYPYLPRETRGYVPAFVGAMYAMTYYKEYGLVPAQITLPAGTDTMEIHRNLHFRQINEVVGIPMEDLKNLNPQYTHEIIPGNEGTCLLKIPYSWTAAFMDADKDSLYLHKSTQLLNPQILKNIKDSGSEVRTAYKVRNGDYLGRIASRYHVSVKQLMKWNHLRSTAIRPGQVLYIYHRGAGPADAAPSNSQASKPAAAKPQQSKPAESKPVQQSGKPASAEYTIYVVKSGDSLYTIAKKYPGVSAKNIMDYNHIGSSIRPGMKLKIPKL